MSLFVRDIATRRVASEARVLMADGSRPVDKMMLRDANGLRQFYQRGIRPAATPSSLDAVSNPRIVAYTATVSVAATGGTPPYSHSWSVPVLSPSMPTSASTNFAIPRGYEGYVVATDTVQDSTGLTATVQVPINVTLVNGGGGSA